MRRTTTHTHQGIMNSMKHVLTHKQEMMATAVSARFMSCVRELGSIELGQAWSDRDYAIERYGG